MRRDSLTDGQLSLQNYSNSIVVECTDQVRIETVSSTVNYHSNSK